MSEKHELAENYDHLIRWHKERFRRWAKWGIIVTVVTLLPVCFLFVATRDQRGLKALSVTIISCAVTFYVAALILGLPHFLFARTFEKLRMIALSYPPHVSIGVDKAHQNVRLWLINPKEENLAPKLFGQLCARYCELEKLSTDELRQKLDAGGVWNPNNGWYEKGRTLDEGLIMAIYTRRADKETVEIEATKATHKKLSHETAIAPDLQARKLTEQQKEAIEQELDELNKEPGRFIDWDLDDLEGSARMFLRGDEVVRVTFTLPNGLYKITVIDSETVTDLERGGKKMQKLLQISEGEGGFDLTPPIRAGQIFVANESGKNEIISLD